MAISDRVQRLVQELYSTVDKLEALFPGRHFTPDGHMVGSIGECLVAEAYGLTLMTASNKGFDAVDGQNRQIEIKATQGRTVAFRSEPQFVIVIQIHTDGTYSEIYNGLGSKVWELFENRARPSNGQFQVSVNKLKALNALVYSKDRIRQQQP